MLSILGKIPHKVIVACSGGVDSMAVLSFLSRRKTLPEVAYFNHGTEHSKATQRFVENYCLSHRLTLHIGKISRDKDKRESMEEYWRNERYSFLHSLDQPVITAHNLDDCIETWIFTGLHGNPRTIAYSNKNVIRPFLTTPKSDMIDWCQRNSVTWAEDISNLDVKYSRNRIRHNIIPEAMVINPGLHKVIKKKVLADFENYNKE